MPPQDDTNLPKISQPQQDLSQQINPTNIPPVIPTAPVNLQDTKTSSQPKSKLYLILGLVLLLSSLLVVGIYYGYRILFKKHKNINSPIETKVSFTPLPNLQFDINSVGDSIFKKAEGSIASTSDIIGQLKPNESVNLNLDIDENKETIFLLTTTGGFINFSLTSPSGLIINKTFSDKSPNISKYEDISGSPETPHFQSYTVTSPEKGKWSVNLTNTDVALNYKLTTLIPNGISLQSSSDKPIYKIGDKAIIAARLQNSQNLKDLKLSANIQKPGGDIDNIDLIQNSNGIFVGQYTIPNVSGYITIKINATGINEGLPFNRQGNLLLSINSQSAKLTGAYSENVKDSDNNGLYDSIDFTFEVETTKAVECSISVELYKNNELVTQRGDYFKLGPGKQPVTLSFIGREINKSRLDGPYEIRQIFITPIDTGVTSDSSKDTVLVTKPYKYSQFEPDK